MAVIQLVPETKMVDVGQLISLENLLIRKLTRFVLTTTSTSLILSCAFGADHMTRIAYIYIYIYIYSLVFQELILSHFDLQKQHTHTHTHSLSLSLSLSLSIYLSITSFSNPRNSLTLPVRKRQLNTRNMGAHTFSKLFFFLFCLFG